jgi:hypothetical protein
MFSKKHGPGIFKNQNTGPQIGKSIYFPSVRAAKNRSGKIIFNFSILPPGGIFYGGIMLVLCVKHLTINFGKYQLLFCGGNYNTFRGTLGEVF